MDITNPVHGMDVFTDTTHDFLNLIMSKDSYDSTVAAVGELRSEHYMKLPVNMTLSNTSPSVIGTPEAAANITDLQMAQIYALNKDVFEGEEMRIKGALLRLELFLTGWCTSPFEVSFVEPLLNAAEIMDADLPTIRTYQADAKVLAYLLPLATEHMFRTLGHNFRPSNSAEYAAKCKKFFAACLFPIIANYMPADLLYHRAAHWVSLGLALAVAKDPTQAERLPNAVVIRAKSASAGNALITTSVAILEEMEAGLRKDLSEHSGVKIKALMDVAEKIKSDPAAYHLFPKAYGKPVLSTELSEELNEQKSAAKKLAPVLQGYLDSLPRNSTLAHAKALQKYANESPLLYLRAKTFFKSNKASIKHKNRNLGMG
jgi:hypothetical protein